MKEDIKELIQEEVESIKSQEANCESNLAIVEDEQLPVIQDFPHHTAIDVINAAKNKILDKAKAKIDQEKILDKHADKLSEVADDMLKVETEKAEIEVEKKAASNKAEKQEIKNRLIVLKNEAKRLHKAEKHKNKLQKIEIDQEKKAKRWDMLESTLKPLGYDYVPNPIALYILLMLVGLKAFFNGVGNVGAAVLKCFKWFLFIGLAIAIVLIIPVTRVWILELLGFLR